MSSIKGSPEDRIKLRSELSLPAKKKILLLTGLNRFPSNNFHKHGFHKDMVSIKCRKNSFDQSVA